MDMCDLALHCVFVWISVGWMTTNPSAAGSSPKKAATASGLLARCKDLSETSSGLGSATSPTPTVATRAPSGAGSTKRASSSAASGGSVWNATTSSRSAAAAHATTATTTPPSTPASSDTAPSHTPASHDLRVAQEAEAAKSGRNDASTQRHGAAPDRTATIPARAAKTHAGLARG